MSKRGFKTEVEGGRLVARDTETNARIPAVYAAEVQESLNDEIPMTDSGELVPAMAKSWESEVD